MRHIFTQIKVNAVLVLVLFFLLNALTVSSQNIPNGYYSTADGKTGFELKTALHNIIKDHSVKSYSSLWSHFESTDKKENGKIWDMYSNCDWTFGSSQQDNGTGGTVECDKFNREHSFPKSWFADASPMESDLYHLYPTDKKVNNERGSFPFGEVGTASYTSANGSKRGNSSYAGYSGTVFEPLDEYKGDFARTYFYMATRYQNIIAGWPGSAMLDGSSDKVFTTWALNMLTEWHEQDPVSDKEKARVDAVYSIQNNRNPFIDHPEYVTAVWGTGNGGGDGGGDNPNLIIEDFSTCTAPNIGTWTAHSIVGDQVWDCALTFGVGSSGAARINSFVGGNNANEDWLVSPKFTLVAGASFSLKADLNFAGDAPKIKISSNYSGTGSPASATWTDLGETWPAPTTANGDFETVTANLSGHIGDRYIAIVYYSSATSGSRLTIDDLALETGDSGGGGTPTISTTASVSGYNLGYVVSGNNSASQTYKVSGTDLTGDVTVSTTAPFQVSSNNTSWSTSILIPQASATNYDVYVRYSPTTANGAVSNGTIQHTSAGATAVSVNVSGTEGEQGVTPIGTLRDAIDVNGVPIWSGSVSLRGIVYGVNILTGNQFQFSLIDNTGAITIRNGVSANAFGTLVEGDEVEVVGTVGHFNGLMQVSVTQAVEIISQGNTIKNPSVVATLNEESESDLVTLEGVTITNPAQWLGSATNTASFNLDINVNGNLYVMRIDKATDLAKKTLAQVLGGNATNNLEISGLGGQFDNSAPHNTGYQLLPYRLDHVRTGVPRATLSFETSGAVLLEPTSSFPVKILLDQPTTSTESLVINVTNGAGVTYGAGQDYRTLPAIVSDQITLSLSAGVSSVSFVINVLDDDLLESRESVTFTMGTVSQGLRVNNSANKFELSIIDNNPSIVTIKEVRSINAQGRSVYEEALVKVDGVVHGINTMASQNNMEFRVIDTNSDKRAGITVRKLTSGNLDYTVAEGDLVSVTGLVSTQNGLLTLNPTSISKTSGGNTLVQPRVVTDLIEAHESDLVRMNILMIQSGWGVDLGGYYNVTVSDGLEQFIVRIDDDTDIFDSAAPQAISVSGFVVQDDPVAPFDGEYYLLPRSMADVSILTESNQENVIQDLSFFPNPSSGTVTFKGQSNMAYQLEIVNIQGKQVYSDLIINGETIDLATFGEGMYMLRLSSTTGTITQKLIIKK